MLINCFEKKKKYNNGRISWFGYLIVSIKHILLDFAFIVPIFEFICRKLKVRDLRRNFVNV